MGCEPHRPPEGSFGFFQPAAAPQRVAQIVVCLRKAGLEFDRPLATCDRGSKIAVNAQCSAKIIVGSG